MSQSKYTVCIYKLLKNLLKCYIKNGMQLHEQACLAVVRSKNRVDFRKLDQVERSKSALEVEAKKRTPKPEVSTGYDYGTRNPNHTEEPEPGDYFFFLVKLSLQLLAIN